MTEATKATEATDLAAEISDVSSRGAPPDPAVAAPTAAALPLWRKVLPFVVGAALVAFVLSGIDFDSFVAALRSTHYVGFLGFMLLFNLALLVADAAATTFVYTRTVCPIRFREMFVIRGASYLPSSLNHNLGQAWLTYFVSKAYGASLWRVAGATLLVYASNLACLVLFGLVALPFNHDRVPWLAPTVGILLVAGVGYLAVIIAKPRFLLARQATAPLADAGVSGHLAAVATRLPHMMVQFAGAWLPFYFFGVDIPMADALALVPVVMLVSTLPITPQGVGTRDVVAVQLFASYAPGTPEEAAAAVAATTLSLAATLTLVQVGPSPLFLRKAYKLLGEQRANS